MQESFLHYIWQYQYFDKEDLRTTEGDEMVVLHPGNRNTNAGPDFFNARVKIGTIEWIGSVEIHVNSAGWTQHKHDTDLGYENVVLHVVWKNDKPVKRNDGTWLPVIELKNRVEEKLVLKYNALVSTPETIPCSPVLSTVPDIVKISMLDSTLLHRLEKKANLILELLQRNDNNWEETGYQLLCKNFGFNVNAEPFLQLAQSLPYILLLKHADKLLQLESILFGQAGFLEGDDGDAYYQLLKREHRFLSQKYQLTEKKLNKAQWRFLRLRPANFPTIRLAQLAALIHHQKNIFSKIIGGISYLELREIFAVEQSVYWLHHYQFSKEVKETISGLGKMSIDTIIINTVVPLLAAYSKAKDEQSFMDRAVYIMQHIPSENNAIMRQWFELGLKSKTAFDSQALIELYSNFCQRKKCLECNIGASLVRPSAT